MPLFASFRGYTFGEVKSRVSGLQGGGRGHVTPGPARPGQRFFCADVLHRSVGTLTKGLLGFNMNHLRFPRGEVHTQVPLLCPLSEATASSS